MLGPVEVRDAGRLLPLGGYKQRALLAILLIQPNRMVPADRLIELIWGDDPPETAGNTVQVYISGLRKALEPDPKGQYRVLIRQAPGYVLRVEREELDLERFERLVSKAKLAAIDGDHETSADTFRRALAIWRGPALADFASEQFALAERARLNEMRLTALEERIEADLKMGRHADLVGELEALVAEYSTRERFCGQLMLALYRSGRQAEASAVYQRTRRTLVEELGMEPGPDLQRLLKAILNQDPALEVISRSKKSSWGATNLPRQLTAFVGRTADIVAIKDLLLESPLVTLVGSGGVGKTRLAVQIALQVGDEYADGVWLVDLAPITDPELVPETVLTALGLGHESGRTHTEALVDFLDKRNALIVLDNCEHLLESAALLAIELLKASVGLRILATSQEPLGIDGERIWRLETLPVPSAGSDFVEISQCDAVVLYADRAVASNRGFALSDKNLATVAEVCRRLDGIPLALELAAARSKLMTVEEILARLDDRFALLTGGSRLILPRHQTLRGTVDWSHELLTDRERVLFRRLSVFTGGFTLSAAERVCGGDPLKQTDVVDLLTRLVDKSLVAAQSNGRPRFNLLATLRQYGNEKLTAAGEDRTYLQRHADYYLTLAQDSELGLRGPNEAAWFAELEHDVDNLRSALAWYAVNDSANLLKLAAALGDFWIRGRVVEGREVYSRALAGAREPTALRAKALYMSVMLAWWQDEYQYVLSASQEAVSIARSVDDPLLIGLSLRMQASAQSVDGKSSVGKRLYEESVEILRKVGEPWALALSLGGLGRFEAT